MLQLDNAGWRGPENLTVPDGIRLVFQPAHSPELQPANNVRYVLGLAGNRRRIAKILPELRKARRKAKRTGQPARELADFRYRTRKSWSCERRVIGKAEWTGGEANPRFIAPGQ